MVTGIKTEENIELLSSAFTLSDMEIFVFPDLLYALVLANILSPEIWLWRSDPWFEGIEKKPPMQRINRVKQYIMNHYVFNLDLETWGLTTKERELKRFEGIINKDVLKKSNALFGYEGDKYYFDIDIRRHFGLDKYDSNIIPYWKTETIEAMNSFKNKPGFRTGAGECVSLSTLYAAALFVVARIPLEKIYLMTTPLHSQNFIDINKGVLTNNRRILTKNMWFNGTSLSTKARRAIENEEITIISHITGYIHTVYRYATIDVSYYEHFKDKLKQFLTADLQPAIISNFLRKEISFQNCFQFSHIINGKRMYIPLERVYRYEHTSSNSFSTDSRNALLKEIDIDEFSISPIPGRILLNDFEDFIKRSSNMSIDRFIQEAKNKLSVKNCVRTDILFDSIKNFILTTPRLPDYNKTKNFVVGESLEIPTDSQREDIYNYIVSKSKKNSTAKLALYAFRDMNQIEWEPFIKAAIERNPVSSLALKEKEIGEIVNILQNMRNHSIYKGNRLAQPDEVWNFQTGDGIEKAFLLANVIYNNENLKNYIEIKIDSPAVFIFSESIGIKKFSTDKNFKKDIKIV